MINNSTLCLQKKREQFALNMKRIDRETLFANNRQKLIQHNQELDKVLLSLNGAITIYNKKDIKNYLKQLMDFASFTYQQEERLVSLVNQLLNLKVEDDNSTLHNEALNILVKLSLSNQTSLSLFNQLTLMGQLIEKYNNYINQSLSYQILDKILAFIGNISCNNGFIESFKPHIIDVLIHQMIYGQKRLLIQSIWTINNILYAFHNEATQLNQILIQIGKSELPQYLIQYVKKNENKFEKNQLVQIYWLYAELSTTIPYDIAELNLQGYENNDLQLIILFIYANLTGQKIVPKYLDVQHLFKLFTCKQALFQRQILVIVANLVLLQQIDHDALKNLINYAFPICPIDTMILLNNCQKCYTLQLNEQERETITRIIQEIQSDPVVEEFIQQLKLNY